jgi:hypothetical protein
VICLTIVRMRNLALNKIPDNMLCFWGAKREVPIQLKLETTSLFDICGLACGRAADNF